MKKLILVLMIIQSGFMVAQTKTVATINGEKIQVNPNSINTADNGLTSTAGNVQLGGALLKPTTLTTTSSNTLSIGGLVTGSEADNVLVAGSDGILKWVTRASFMQAGDNLGNHTATQDLKMSTKNIVGATNITATGTVVVANATVSTKTTTQTAAITKGTDGSIPAPGYVPTAADALGNIKWTDPSTIATKGDNLGNHLATTTLEMSKNTINNINVEYFSDQIPANTYRYGIYKNNGVFGFWSDKVGNNDFTINENTRKTSVNNLAISKGTDGSNPATDYLAVAADNLGNVVWKSPASVVAENQFQADWNMTTTTDPSYIKNKPVLKGDDLGNHVATQDLNMNSKNILAANNITATGKAIIGASTATNVMQIKAASDPVTIEGLTVSTNTADVGLVVDANGVVRKAAAPPPTRATYVTTSLAPGQSYTATLTISPQTTFFLVTTNDGCGKSAIAAFSSVNYLLSFLGGQARGTTYTGTPASTEGDMFAIKTQANAGCSDGGDSTQFDFDIQKTNTTIIITNRGNINKQYTIRQSEF